MKLAEALILRADLNKRIELLRERLQQNAKVQEGDQPAERPEDLPAEFERATAELETLIRRIDATNSSVDFEDGVRISDALAIRDNLDLQIRTTRDVIVAAAERERLFTRSEVKYIPTLDAASLQRHLDELSRRRRELDARLQAVNRQVELL